MHRSPSNFRATARSHGARSAASLACVAAGHLFLACSSSDAAGTHDAAADGASLIVVDPAEAGPSADAGADVATEDATTDAAISHDAAAHDASPLPEAGSDGGACASRTGTFHAQTITAGGETRFYYLHVPTDYDCTKPWPVLFDFHGTCDDTNGPPEECYNVDDAANLADAEHFVLVRPRSRFFDEGGTHVYRWDENDGDIPKNTAFVETLLTSLQSRYVLDAERTYAMGFSSGTNMASQFLGMNNPGFHGVGVVCGGLWDNPGLPTWGAGVDAPRIYVVDGYKDYFYSNLTRLMTALEAKSYPKDHLFYRQTDTGHEQYGWHYAELWNWLDKGTKPAAGSVASPWVRDTTFPGTATLLKAVVNAAGDVLVTGDRGEFYRRDHATNAWSKTATIGTSALPAPHFTGMCVLPSGRGLAVGDDGAVAQTDDGGKSWALAPSIPEYDQQSFGYSYATDLACQGTETIFAVGDWVGALSKDGGKTWQANPMPYADTAYPGTSAAVAFSDTGTGVAGGWSGYQSRSQGGAFTMFTLASAPSWWNGVAAAPGGKFWMVGDGGTIAHSSDNGVTWTEQSVLGGEDLYAVAFGDANVGVAVGVHGYALVTKNGGKTWTPTPTGLDAMLADVVFVTPTQALVVGGAGTMLDLNL